MPTECLILRRCHPVPVTFADLRAARCDSDWVAPWERAAMSGIGNGQRRHAKFRKRPVSKSVARWWTMSLKSQTGAVDEVYAVIDGHEVRVAIASSGGVVEMVGGPRHIARDIADLLIKADEAGYWERPHEVVHVLEERAISRRAVNLACGASPDKAGA